MKDTASTIGSKSLDMVETGKLKLQRTQLETTIKEKLHREAVLASPAPAFPHDIPDASSTSQILCSKCGQEFKNLP